GMTKSKLYKLLELSSTVNCPNSGPFTQCSGTDKLWYSSNLQSFVFGFDGASILTLKPNELEIFAKTLVKAIFNDIFQPPGPDAKDFLEKAHKFDRIYIAQGGTEGVHGRQETMKLSDGREMKLIYVEYLGITSGDSEKSKFCASVNKRYPGTCRTDRSYPYVRLSIKDGSEPEIFEAWTQLTAQIRML
ncbi:hypothetical protein KY320_00255, partial [Candidatus Woesearchaeota archaeon]|nr:hypothetical protein [Candidatus Woesearchaeota archaeon]